VGADGIARVLDFGIAKAQGRIQVTRDGQIKGKLAYMPPEQLAGRELSRAVDIYASAVVMWETLTGERLFKGDTEGETLAKILRDPVLAPTAVVPDLPKGFDGPLLRSLSRDVSRRHTTAKELALELERCCGIASPTEVGEWVEDAVGHVLSAREAQIAEIESSSVGMSIADISGDSDSDMSLPSSRAILAAGGSPIDTLPMGSGPPVSGRRMAPPTPTAPMTPVGGPATARTAGDEGTGSRSRSGLTGMLTGTMLRLPVDRKLPILASIGGIIVLFAVVGVVLAGKFSRDADASGSAASSASVTAVTTTAPSDTNAAPPANTDRDIPDPPPSIATADEPADDDTPAPSAPVKPTVKPTVTTKPPTPPKPTISPPPKKSCDPPYTIDATGRKKYKLECM
ncbi:MAG: protein kinase, partial [Labilithrix sp.]|nr:protein kinase [Labilithrix sp.]